MAFKSNKQRRWMYANEPEIAKKWSAEYHNQGGMTGGNMQMKKMIQKDRYGNQVTYEYEVGEKALDPTALMSKQMEMMMPPMESQEPPVMGEEFNMGHAPSHPGGPRGEDTVPAWLTPGEFVVNKEATQMFGPEIEAMNNVGRMAQGGQVQYREGGGPMLRGFSSLEDLLAEREGFREDIYLDSLGKPTVGYGRLVEDAVWDPNDPRIGTKPYSVDQLEQFKKDDIQTAAAAAQRNVGTDTWNKLTTPQQWALTSQAFQLGGTGQSKFKKQIEAIQAGDMAEAARQAYDSKWFGQTPKRTHDLAAAFAPEVMADYKFGGGMIGPLVQFAARLAPAVASAYGVAQAPGQINNMSDPEPVAPAPVKKGLGWLEQQMGQSPELEPPVQHRNMGGMMMEPEYLNDGGGFWNKLGQGLKNVFAPNDLGGAAVNVDEFGLGSGMATDVAGAPERVRAPVPYNDQVFRDMRVGDRSIVPLAGAGALPEYGAPPLPADRDVAGIAAANAAGDARRDALAMQIANSQQVADDYLASRGQQFTAADEGQNVGGAGVQIPGISSAQADTGATDTAAGAAPLPEPEIRIATHPDAQLADLRDVVNDPNASQEDRVIAAQRLQTEWGGAVDVSTKQKMEALLGNTAINQTGLEGAGGAGATDQVATAEEQAEAAKVVEEAMSKLEDGESLTSDEIINLQNAQKTVAKQTAETDEETQKLLSGQAGIASDAASLQRQENALRDQAYEDYVKSATTAGQPPMSREDWEAKKGDVTVIPGSPDGGEGTGKGPDVPNFANFDPNDPSSFVAPKAGLETSLGAAHTLTEQEIQEANDAFEAGQKAENEGLFSKDKFAAYWDDVKDSFGEEVAKAFSAENVAKLGLKFAGAAVFGVPPERALQWAVSTTMKEMEAADAAAADQAAKIQQQAAVLAQAKAATPDSLEAFKASGGDFSKLVVPAKAAKAGEITNQKVFIPGEGLRQVWKTGDGQQYYKDSNGTSRPLEGSGARVYDAATMSEKAIKENTTNNVRAELNVINQGLPEDSPDRLVVNQEEIATEANRAFNDLMRDANLTVESSVEVRNAIDAATRDFLADKSAFQKGDAELDPQSIRPYIDARIIAAKSQLNPTVLQGTTIKGQRSINQLIEGDPDFTGDDVAPVWQAAQSAWAVVPDDVKKSYNNSVPEGSGFNGFTHFMKLLLAGDEKALQYAQQAGIDIGA